MEWFFYGLLITNQKYLSFFLTRFDYIYPIKSLALTYFTSSETPNIVYSRINILNYLTLSYSDNFVPLETIKRLSIKKIVFIHKIYRKHDLKR